MIDLDTAKDENSLNTPMKNCNFIKNRWDEISYPDDNCSICNTCGSFSPMGETPVGGSWPLTFFKKEDNNFTDLKGNVVSFNIKTPDVFDDFCGKELAVVLEIGKNLTNKEKKIAGYWGYGIVENQITPILQCLLNTYSVPVLLATRIYKLLYEALNDAMIICWYFKYLYQIPRAFQYAPCFTPYLKTPHHPSYPAGHSVSAGCMEVILSYFFPCEKEKLNLLAEECSISRIYAGVHYPMDGVEGLKLGRDVAYKVLSQIQNSKDIYSAVIDHRYTNYKDAPIYPVNYTQKCIC